MEIYLVTPSLGGPTKLARHVVVMFRRVIREECCFHAPLVISSSLLGSSLSHHRQRAQTESVSIYRSGIVASACA